MKFFWGALSAAVVLFVQGCVSYSYDGKTEPSTGTEVKVFTDSGKISRAYRVLGQAVVSGNYQHVSRDRMIEKLTSEAKKAGADAVLIVEQQVLPLSMLSGSRKQGFFTAFSYDDTNSSWGELYRDVDVTIGNIGKERNTPAGTSISEYKRIIRAEFLHFEKAGTPQKKK